MDKIERFEKILASGQDNAMLRFGLGSAYLAQGNGRKAAEHLAKAVESDPDYSAAWKLYGKALATTGDLPEARAAYQRGIITAERKGDIQAAKEMKVFLKRLG